MVFFSKSVMNGASLFGVSVTLSALGFLKAFDSNAKVILFSSAGIYGFAALLAFLFPGLSEKQKTKPTAYYATLYTIAGVLFLVMGILDFREVGELLLICSVIMAGLSWYWIRKAIG